MNNKGIKSWLAVVLAVAIIVGVGLFTGDRFLHASDGDGGEITETEKEVSVKKEEPKEEKKEEAKPVEKTEEPKEEKKEEPKEEKVEEKIEEEAVEVKEEAAPEVSEEPVEAVEDVVEDGVEAVEEAEQVKTEPATEEAAIEEAAESKLTVSVSTANKSISIGETCKLEATVEGAKGAYTVQWQYNDGNGWIDIEGATGTSYKFVVTAENMNYEFRVIVTEA